MTRTARAMSASSRGPRDVYVASASHAFVSQSGMVALLKSVREHGLPEHISRQTLKRTRVQALPGHTPLGPLQSTLSRIEEQGGTLELPCISPWPLLFATLERNESFRANFEGVLASSNNSAGNPFKVALYCDEILPGDQLKATNSRKMVAFYWSVMDFGNQLGRDVLWFQISICRTSHIKQVAGQYSQLFKKICELFTKPPFDGRLGLSLPLNGPCKFGFSWRTRPRLSNAGRIRAPQDCSFVCSARTSPTICGRWQLTTHLTGWCQVLFAAWTNVSCTRMNQSWR